MQQFIRQAGTVSIYWMTSIDPKGARWHREDKGKNAKHVPEKVAKNQVSPNSEPFVKAEMYQSYGKSVVV